MFEPPSGLHDVNGDRQRHFGAPSSVSMVITASPVRLRFRSAVYGVHCANISGSVIASHIFSTEYGSTRGKLTTVSSPSTLTVTSDRALG
ncbi:hypothetical protein ACETU7_15735 [Rhodococcus sp. 3Y1]